MDKLVIGCGYLGRRVADLWLQQGHRVHVTSRDPERCIALSEAAFEPICCDVLDIATLKNLPQVDTVLYAVGYDRSATPSKYDVYVKGIANVLSALSKPDRFIQISSTGVYGQSEGEAVDEESTTEPSDESGKIVLETERVLHREMPDAIILRFAGIYGPGRLLRQRAIEEGAPIATETEHWLNLIHVADGARAVLAAEEHAADGSIYNICDDRPTTRREFYTYLAKVLNAPSPNFVAPDAESKAIRRAQANRRVSNQRMRDELRVTLQFPSYHEGLDHIVHTHRNPTR